MKRIHLLRLIAVIPVCIAASLNTGYQYLIALALNEGSSIGDWRDRIVRNLGIDYSDPGALDIMITGFVHVLPVMALAFLVGGVWERLFSLRCNRPFEIGFIYTAILFTLLMHPGAGFFHIIFGMSFAIVIAKAIFGGEGKTFLSPALVGVAVVQISFPGALTNHPLWTSINGYAGTRLFAVYHEQGPGGLVWSGVDWWSAFYGNIPGLMGTTSVLAILVGGIILIYGGIASWRLLAGQIIGLVLVATLCNISGDGILGLPWYWHMVLGSYAIGAVFIATDPTSSAATNAGRWAQGLLLGALVVLIRVINPSHPDGVIPVLLLGSMLAPLIDHAVIWFNIRRRALRHG
jgi:Na+-transporting NADH:ubiquinone oxidoreductase subunit B